MCTWLEDLLALVSLAALAWVALLWAALLDIA